MTYTNQYGRFSVLDDLCGYSMGATVPVTGEPTPLAPTAEASLFGTSNGIPPTAGVNLINDLAPGGPKEDRVSTPDQDLRGALCLRALATGKETAASSTDGALAAQAHRVAQGVREVLATGDLHGVPAVYVVGRSDANLPPNFTGRAYYGLNQAYRRASQSAALLRGHERASSGCFEPVPRLRQSRWCRCTTTSFRR